MCLAIPSEIIKQNNLMATVDVMGARREVSLMLMPEDVQVGDFVLVHAGFAIQKVDPQAAQDALQLIDTILEKQEQDMYYS